MPLARTSSNTSECTRADTAALLGLVVAGVAVWLGRRELSEGRTLQTTRPFDREFSLARSQRSRRAGGGITGIGGSATRTHSSRPITAPAYPPSAVCSSQRVKLLSAFLNVKEETVVTDQADVRSLVYVDAEITC